ARAMAGRADDGARREGPGRRRQSADATMLVSDAIDTHAVMQRASKGLDLAPQVADDGSHAIRSQMRPIVVADGFNSRTAAEFIEDETAARVLRPARQLAVAERPGAAFAEEIVALRQQSAAAMKRFDVAHALVHARAALEHERLESLSRQDES